MIRRATTLLGVLASTVLAASAQAQMAHGGGGMGGAEMQLPQPCVAAETPPMGEMDMARWAGWRVTGWR